jgi:hypothetical protein
VCFRQEMVGNSNLFCLGGFCLLGQCNEGDEPGRHGKDPHYGTVTRVNRLNMRPFEVRFDDGLVKEWDQSTLRRYAAVIHIPLILLPERER